MSKVYTPFQTKKTQKQTLWTRVGIYLYEKYGLYKGVPPWGGGGQWDHFKCKFLISACQSTAYHHTPQKTHPAPPKEYPVVIRILVSILLLFVSNRRLHLYRILKVYLILFWLPRK